MTQKFHIMGKQMTFQTNLMQEPPKQGLEHQCYTSLPTAKKCHTVLPLAVCEPVEQYE
jgi:hypothetical protein